jgi:hypothetical protein
MTYIPPNPNGNAAAANSTPVTLASDNNGPVKVWDGTNTANVIALSGKNGLYVTPNAATAASIPSTAEPIGSQARTSLPVAVASGQLVNNYADKFGRQVVIPQTTRDLVGMQAYTFTANTSAQTVVSAAGSGVYADILSITLVNTGTSATEFILSDGTNSYTYYAPAGDMRGAVYQVPLAATATNTVWTGTCGTSTSSLICTITYAKNQ